MKLTAWEEVNAAINCSTLTEQQKRLVAADLLYEQGWEAEAELVRVEVELEQMGEPRSLFRGDIEARTDGRLVFELDAGAWPMPVAGSRIDVDGWVWRAKDGRIREGEGKGRVKRTRSSGLLVVECLSWDFGRFLLRRDRDSKPFPAERHAQLVQQRHLLQALLSNGGVP